MTRLLLLAALLSPAVVLAGEPAEDPEWGTTIQVEVPRPKVSYIVTRQKLDDLELRPLRGDFVPKIVRSVNEKPF